MELSKLSFEQVFCLPEFTIEHYCEINQAKMVPNFYLNRLTATILLHNDGYLNKRDMLFSEQDNFNKFYILMDSKLKQELIFSPSWFQRKEEYKGVETRIDFIRTIFQPSLPKYTIASQEKLDEIQGFFETGLSVMGFVPTSLAGITDLYLRDNKIGDAGIKELANSLKYNTTLVKFNLGGNGIGDEGISELAEALKINETLVDLNLFYNNITSVGAKKLAEALEVNKSLINLNLGSNELGNIGARELAEALKINKTLLRLSLIYNRITDEDAIKDLTEALKINKRLIILSLDGNNFEITYDLRKEIEKGRVTA